MYPALRKVKSNGRTVVGQFSSLKASETQYESFLEECFIPILDFDSDVEAYHSQAVQLLYKDDSGKDRRYTPDFLVKYRNRNPVLFEVKPRQFLEKYKKELKPKFSAAQQYASERAWEFRVISDKEISTVYVDSLQHLFHYQTYISDPITANDLLEALSKLGRSTPNTLIRKVSQNSELWPILISNLWTLIFNRKICCNLFEKIHMEIPIWVNTKNDFKELKFPYKS